MLSNFNLCTKKGLKLGFRTLFLCKFGVFCAELSFCAKLEFYCFCELSAFLGVSFSRQCLFYIIRTIIILRVFFLVDRDKILFTVDVGLALAFFASALTGILKFPGFLHFFGMDYRALQVLGLNTVHDFSGILMACLVLIHLFLHWRWIVGMIKKFSGVC